ncbi:MAG: aminotransferase class III-fold pyridoxal phosphate-dependent enzyme, partial [Elioraea tepidiphila]
AAVAIETLKIYDEIDIVGHVREVGAYFQSELRRRFQDHPLVGEVRGIGLIGAVELVEDKAARRNFPPARKVGAKFVKLAEQQGLISRAMVLDSIGFSPPLVITKSEIGEMLDRFGRALDELAVQLRREAIAPVA